MCKMIPFLQSTSILVCSFTIATIAIDRLIRITRNYQRSTYQVLFEKTHRWLIAIETLVIWVLSLLFSLPVAYYQTLFRVSFEGSVNFIKCIENWPNETAKGYYALFIMVTQFFMPTIVLIVTHMIIGHRLNCNLSGLTEASSVNMSSCTVLASNVTKVDVTGDPVHTVHAGERSSISVSLDKSTSISNINPCYSRYFNSSGVEDSGSRKNSVSKQERCASRCAQHPVNISDDATLTSGLLRCPSGSNAVEDTSPLMASEIINWSSTVPSEEEVEVEEEEMNDKEVQQCQVQRKDSERYIELNVNRDKQMKLRRLSTSSVGKITIDTREALSSCASDRVLHDTQSNHSTGRECEISIECEDAKSNAQETDTVVVLNEIDYSVSEVSDVVLEDAVIRSTSMPYIRKVECISCNETCKRRASSFFANRLLRVSRISPSSSVNTEPGVYESSSTSSNVFQARKSKWKSEMDQVKELDNACVPSNSCRLSKLTGIDLSKIDDHHHPHHQHHHEYHCPSHLQSVESAVTHQSGYHHQAAGQVIREMPHELPDNQLIRHSSANKSTGASNVCGDSSNLSTRRETRASVGGTSTTYTSSLHQSRQDKVNDRVKGDKFVQETVPRKAKFRSARFPGRVKTVKLSTSRLCNVNTDSLPTSNTVTGGGGGGGGGESLFSRERMIPSPAFLSRDSPSCATRISDERGILMREIRRNRQVTCVLLSISACFTLTWLPWNVFNVYLDFNVDTSLTIDQIYLIQAICHLIAMITIPSNAFWYGWSNPLIRSEGLRFLSSMAHLIRVKCIRFCSNFSSSSSSSSSSTSSSRSNGTRGAVASNIRISNSLTC